MEVQYPLNDHACIMFGLGSQFMESVDDDIPSNLDANKSDTKGEDEYDDDDINALED